MHRLVENLATDDFRLAHPGLQASYAHYSLSAIHPAPDGNGRVARALASVCLITRMGIRLVFWSDQHEEYLKALREANDERYQPFVDCVFDRGIETVKMVGNRLARHGGRDMSEIQTLVQARGELSIAELGARSQSVQERLRKPLPIWRRECHPAWVRWVSVLDSRTIVTASP